MAVEKLIVDHIDTWTTALQTRSTAGRGSSGKIDLYGIKKLRELILELAVRGKLVPQDPNDEPASVLLKRIAAEKAELVRQGKIKKQKPLPEISEEEKPFELPVGWEWVRLGDFTNIIRGITFPGSEKAQTYSQGKIACLRTANVQEQIDWDDLIYISDRFVKREDQFLQENDIVMSMANSRELVGKVALASLPNHSKFTFGGFLSVLRPLFVNEQYLMALLRCETYKSQLIESASQTTNIANISLAKLNPLLVCLPPANEQTCIAKKLSELMALCDQLEQHSLASLDAHQQLVDTLLTTLTNSQNADELAENWARISEHFDMLFTTETSIDALKQTILQLAVMGKLVPQDPNDEPASELLKRIVQEKAQLVKDGKIKKQKPLPPISDEEKPFELPSGWQWCKFGLISEFINGDRGSNYPNKNEYVVHGIPWINTGHIEKNGTLSITDMNFITEKKFNELRSGKIQSGDLVYCLRGATFGKTAFVKPYESGAIASSLMIIRPFIREMGEHIYNYLISPFGRSQIFRFDNGSAQPNLSANSVMLYAFACPPLQEQFRIHKKITELFHICDNLKLQIQSAQQTQLHLADALTDAAIN
ncbi:TPA: restriction endonuclease subunit S [Citrobacter freundii]|nr:restriction endonuclease subunit S [Citrobacter freundii]